MIDDFAHNPAKIAAAISDRAAARSKRVLAVYQPHGYGPTRFLRRDFVETFARELEPHDRLWMLEVFYAGGTATRDFSAADIVAEIAAKGAHAEFAPSREWLVARIADEAQAGDLVLRDGRARPVADRACPRDPRRDRERDGIGAGEIAQEASRPSCRTGR